MSAQQAQYNVSTTNPCKYINDGKGCLELVGRVVGAKVGGRLRATVVTVVTVPQIHEIPNSSMWGTRMHVLYNTEYLDDRYG